MGSSSIGAGGLKRALLWSCAMSVFKYLDSSTAHISFETNTFLESVAGSNSLGLTIASYEYGFFVSVPPNPEYHEDVPTDLRNLLDYARTQGCFIVRLDEAADTIDALPTFNW